MADGSGFDFNQLAQRMGLGMGGGGGPNPDAPPKDMDEMITKLGDQLGKFISKFTGIRLDTLGTTGMFAHTDISKAGIRVDSMITPGIVPDARGGVLANIVAEGTQIASVRDFSRLNVPPIEGMAMNTGIDISPADLGTFSPQTFSDAAAAYGRGGDDIGIG